MAKVTHSPLFSARGYVTSTDTCKSMTITREYIMFLSTSDMIFMMVCTGIIGFMLIMLFIANSTLQAKNKYLKQALRDKNKYCAYNHTEVPF